ncbi:hypothetical protein GCM10009000_083760 [Halobacterium noricense]
MTKERRLIDRRCPALIWGTAEQSIKRKITPSTIKARCSKQFCLWEGALVVFHMEVTVEFTRWCYISDPPELI